MSFQIQMPHVGESVTEAVIGKWLKAPGDRVEKYDPIVEVVTDKVAMEVPAPANGSLTKIIAQEGETVSMGAVIAEMDTDEPVEAGTGSNEPEPASAEPEQPASPVSVSPSSAPKRAASSPRSLRVASSATIGSMITGANVGPTGGEFTDSSLQKASDSSVAAQASASADERTDRMSRRISPVVQRLSEQHGIDPTAIAGTGLGGRVTKRDVLRAVEEGSTSAEPVMASSTAAEDRLVRPSAVRSMIAAHMTRSFTEIPHAWSAVEVDVTGLVACRAALKETAQRDHGINLTYLPFAMYEVARSLRANPFLNSSWKDGQVSLKGEINMGVAMAGKDGLVVPVVRGADSKSVVALTRDLNALVEKARSGKLNVEDVRGGTFTLNNTGALGSVWGGAIINHPQAAILTTEAIVKRPVVLSGPTGDSIAIRSMMNICLSFDHRIIDGAEASVFLQDVKRRLEAITPDTALE